MHTYWGETKWVSWQLALAQNFFQERTLRTRWVPVPQQVRDLALR